MANRKLGGDIMKESHVPLGGDSPADTTLEMLKRVLAVAELVTKTVQPDTHSKPPAPEKLPQKTQK
jgi:hypothetical protein